MAQEHYLPWRPPRERSVHALVSSSGCLFHDCLRPGVFLVDLVSVCDRVEISYSRALGIFPGFCLYVRAVMFRAIHSTASADRPMSLSATLLRHHTTNNRSLCTQPPSSEIGFTDIQQTWVPGFYMWHPSIIVALLPTNFHCIGRYPGARCTSRRSARSAG